MESRNPSVWDQMTRLLQKKLIVENMRTSFKTENGKGKHVYLGCANVVLFMSAYLSVGNWPLAWGQRVGVRSLGRRRWWECGFFKDWCFQRWRQCSSGRKRREKLCVGKKKTFFFKSLCCNLQEKLFIHGLYVLWVWCRAISLFDL